MGNVDRRVQKLKRDVIIKGQNIKNMVNIYSPKKLECAMSENRQVDTQQPHLQL